MDNTLHLLPITYYLLPVTWYLLPASNRLRDTCLKSLRDVEWQKNAALSLKNWVDLDCSRPFQSVWLSAAGGVITNVVPRRSK